MSNDYVYTALIDVLGYRNRLNQDIQNGEEKFKDDLEGALSVLNTINNAVFGVQAISDTIILTCNTHEKFIDFLSLIKKIFISFLERGLFIRGGIAYSKHFQSGKITYSHALAKAYELENNMAIYPRIVIDQNIIEMYKTGSNLPYIFRKNLFIRKNDIVYLNILDSDNWESIHSNAKNIFSCNKIYLQKNEQAYIKHVWFENYLFESIDANNKYKRYIPCHETL